MAAPAPAKCYQHFSFNRSSEEDGAAVHSNRNIRLFNMINNMSGGPVQGKVSDVQECAGCHKKIHDKFVLKVNIIK